MVISILRRLLLIWLLRRFLLTILGLAALLLVLDVYTVPETTNSDHEWSLIYLEQTQLPIPPRPFTHDGCTLFPDQFLGYDFRPACLQHDIAYWAGGSDWHRAEADLAFATAISETGALGHVLSPFMYLATRQLGDSWITHSLGVQWGYGQ